MKRVTELDFEKQRPKFKRHLLDSASEPPVMFFYDADGIKIGKIIFPYREDDDHEYFIYDEQSPAQ